MEGGMRPLTPPDRNAFCFTQALGNQLTELKHVRTVAQYMHKELQMVPWTLTANYLKHRGMGSSQVCVCVRMCVWSLTEGIDVGCCRECSCVALACTIELHGYVVWGMWYCGLSYY